VTPVIIGSSRMIKSPPSSTTINLHGERSGVHSVIKKDSILNHIGDVELFDDSISNGYGHVIQNVIFRVAFLEAKQQNKLFKEVR
jgi:hypothetical protein